MSKWSNLEKAEEQSSPFLLFVVPIIIVVAVVFFALKKEPTKTEEKVGEVVETPIAIKELPISAPEPQVLAKSSASSRLWDLDTESLEEPLFHNEDGSSYADYERSLHSERESREVESSTKEGQFGRFEPRKIVKEDVLSWPADVSEAEARNLAREAFQPVSSNMPAEVASNILEDVAIARADCERLGIKLPNLSDEMKDNYNFWAKSSGSVGAYAKQVLSRL